MRINWLIGCCCVAMTTAIVLGQGAATRPGGATPGLDRLRESLNSLNLSEDQKTQIDAVFADARDQVLQMRQNGGQTPQGTQQVMQGIRGKLATILTTVQLQDLRQKMQQTTPTARPPGPRNAAANSDAQTEVAGAPVQADTPKMLEAGAAAPNFKLSTLGGSTVDLSSLKGRVVVLVFGSYSSPMLRDRAEGLNQLMLQDETRAEIYLVYTKEMHAVGGWDSDRNQADHVVEVQPKTMEEKRAAALQCRTSLNLSMPVLVDDMQDTVTAAYGAFPDGAVVIGRDGTIVASQQWTEPTALRRMVEAAASKKMAAATQ